MSTQASDHDDVKTNGHDHGHDRDHPRRAKEGDAVGTRWPRLFARLAAKFSQDEERALTKGKGPNAKVIYYVTARTIMNRLDEVLGCENWWDEYTPQESSVICRLTVRLPDGELLTKVDAGGYAGMSDEGDDDKSGFSDAFKRAAVKFGAGRYLYGEGVAPYVRTELEARRDERKAERGDRREDRRDERKATRGDRESRETETSTRGEVNQAFPTGASEGPERRTDPTPKSGASASKDRETTKLWGDRIGARGLDVRTWLDVQVAAVAAARSAIYRARVDELGLVPLSEDDRPNDYSVLNHLVKVTVEAGATDPYPAPDPKTGKRKAIGNGKKTEHLHKLYLNVRWREWLRAELASYLRKEVRDARINARVEAGLPEDEVDEAEHNPGPIDPSGTDDPEGPEASQDNPEVVYGQGPTEAPGPQGGAARGSQDRPQPPSDEPDDDGETWVKGRE
jgi:hypothetical protein